MMNKVGVGESIRGLLIENIDNIMNPVMKDRGLNEPGFKSKRAKAYGKISKTIMSCTGEDQLEVCLRMVENYERLMLDFYLTSDMTKKETKQSAIDLLSLIKIKRKMIRKG